ncbi:MAG: zinc ribbon domain-containing protein [Phycisphaerales bacterium]|nr:MAG: zinc ribbon domain-containing protein [Phycisphaerales bacterium]
MPLYEYVCTSCNNEFEELSPSTSRGRTPACPECGSDSVNRKLSVFAAREGMNRSAPAPIGPCGQCCSPDGTCPMN